MQSWRGGHNTIRINLRMMNEIQVVVSRLMSKSWQPPSNTTTNLSESWMHIRCKFDGGKVIIRSQSGSWEYRWMGTSSQQNLGKEWGATVWSRMTESPPNPQFLNAAKCSYQKMVNDRKRIATEEAKHRQWMSKYSWIDDTVAAWKAYNGYDSTIEPDDTTDDIPFNYLEEIKRSLYQTKVMITHAEAENIKKRMQRQAMSEEWNIQRRKHTCVLLHHEMQQRCRSLAAQLLDWHNQEKQEVGSIPGQITTRAMCIHQLIDLAIFATCVLYCPEEGR